MKDMHRYVYVLVRCVPEPRTGEFINMAAIAGRPEVGDWSIRRVGSDARARKLQAGTEVLGAVHDFLTRIGQEIEDQPLLSNEAPLDENWLQRLYYDHRNVVQLSAPAPIVANNAEDALDAIFRHQIIDPVSQLR